MAERVGFEPTVEFPLQQISNLPPSARLGYLSKVMPIINFQLARCQDTKPNEFGTSLSVLIRIA